MIGKLWTSEEGSVEQQPSGHVETSACQTLLRGQMLIGQDGKLMKANTAQSEPESNMMYLVNIKGKNSVILVPGLLTWWDDKWTLYFQNCLAEKSSMKKSSLFEQKSLNDFHLAWIWKIWDWLLWAWRDSLFWAWCCELCQQKFPQFGFWINCYSAYTCALRTMWKTNPPKN